MKPPRRRRDPDEARGELLDAAERLLSVRAPDAVGLADIAREAGVSHALVSHYFGTYVGVVDAVLERRRTAVRARVLERLAGPDALEPDALLTTLFDALSDRAFVRLSLWAIAAERPSAHPSFPLQSQGLRILAEAIAQRLGDRRAATRRRIEQAVVLAGSAVWGYVVARDSWMGALGREPSPAFDRGLRKALAEMLRGFIPATPPAAR
jgi:TetR/AcrR family transcriptional regulator, repressor for neighboring sulfatase